MDYRELLTVALDFATAILLGALVGIEREKRKSEEEESHHIAGLRTFILLALFGAAAGFLSRSLSAPWIFAVSLLDRRRGGRGRLLRHGAVEPERQGADHRNRRGHRVPARRHGHVRLRAAGDRARRRHRRGARLQAAAAWLRGEARLGRCLCRHAALDRDLHRAAAPAQRADRSLGRAQSLFPVAARHPDFEPVAGRLCADARCSDRAGAWR